MAVGVSCREVLDDGAKDRRLPGTRSFPSFVMALMISLSVWTIRFGPQFNLTVGITITNLTIALFCVSTGAFVLIPTVSAER